MSPRAGEMLLDEIMPIIQGVVPTSVRQVGCEDAEELVQDALAIAAQMLQALEDAGKQVIIAKSIAYYSIQRIKSGRRSYSSGRTDVCSPETNHTLRLLLEIEDEHAGHHPNLSFEKIAQCWQLPALYDLSNFDSAVPTPNPEYGSLSLPSLLEWLRYYCCQSNRSLGAVLELLLEQYDPAHQADTQHWELMADGNYLEPLPTDDPVQEAWGIVRPPTEEQKQCAEAIWQQRKAEIESEEIKAQKPKRVAESSLLFEQGSAVPKVEPLRINDIELAKRLGKSQRTIANWKKIRVIPFEKIGRNVLYDVAAVDAALKKLRRNPAGD